MIGTWREQYDRMLRSEAKLRGPHVNTDVLTDDLYHFFQDCLHLKDWIRNDQSAPGALSQNVERWVADSTMLKVAADLGNGIKHLQLSNRKRGGAEIVGSDVWIEIGATTSVTAQHRVTMDGGDHYVAQDVAKDAAAEWARLLAPYL